MELKKIGNIVNTKGIHGTLLTVGTPKGLFLSKNTEVFIGYSETFNEKFFLADDFVGNINRTELNLENIDSKEKAQSLKEKGLFANKEIILKENKDFIFQDEIIGCEVFIYDENNTVFANEVKQSTNRLPRFARNDEKNYNSNGSIGKIIEIWELPANDVWLVETEKGNLPLPVIDEVIKEIDIENKVIKIVLIDGLEQLIIKN